MTRFVNNVKTALLLGGLMGLILVIGAQLGGYTGIVIALILGGAMNLIAFFKSDKIAIAAMRGKQVDERSAPDLVHMVSRLAKNADLPMPKVYICPQEAPNAFATGRNPENAAVAVTQGALRLLTYEELEGVMAHELAHVKNRDTLISTVAAIIGGAISALGYMIWFVPIGGHSDEGGNPLALILMLILAPIAAAIIQAAISRSREFVADHDGARIAGTPAGLISALQKLEANARRVPMQHETPAFNHMFIVQPLSAGQAFSKMFSSHPPTQERVAKLREMA